LTAVALLGACAAPPESADLSEPGARHVLLISIDTLRPDHMSLYGYERPTTPRIDAFFEHSLVYERAYAPEASTPPSVVSFLSGLLPQHHGVRLFYQKLPDSTATLADWLRDVGYQTAAVVSNGVLTAEAIGLDERFDDYDDFVDERELHREQYERRAAPTTDAALAWLAESRDASRPHLLWVHYMDPHAPYDPPSGKPAEFSHRGSRPLGGDRGRVAAWRLHPGVDDGLEYVDLYDEEIAYLDREVGRLLDGYRELGLADESLIVFTADHGEAMMEHERWFGHGYHVYEEIVRVPLMIRGLGLPAERLPEPVSLIDLAPSILDAVGAEIPPGLDGRSLLDADATPGTVLAEGGDHGRKKRALIRGDLKYLVSVGRDGPGDRSVFDLARDPLELSPRPWGPEDEITAAHLLELIESDPDPAGVPAEFEQGRRLEGPKIRPDLDEEARARLRALGYLD
jgi:arylsulfatase A-like enzyme